MEERKLFGENEPKNGPTNARDSKENNRTRRSLYYCAGNKRIQREHRPHWFLPVNVYVVIWRGCLFNWYPGANSIRFHLTHRFWYKLTNLAPSEKLYLELSDECRLSLQRCPSFSIMSFLSRVSEADIDYRKSIIGRMTCDKRGGVPAMHRYSTGHYRTMKMKDPTAILLFSK